MKFSLALLALLFSSCAHKNVEVVAPPAKVASSPAPTDRTPIADLQTKEACFLLIDAKTGHLVREVGGAACDRRLTACSTFKVPASIMGFDSGVLKDENTSFKWDGQKRYVETWNQDQTAATWMKYSVVWVTQKITPQIGLPKIKAYLHDFKYGNEDFSSGILTSWLTDIPAGKDPRPKASLQISAREQADFVRRWWKGDLKVSPRAIEMTKKLTFIEKSPKGYELHGKTGSGYLNADHTNRIGWFISHLEGPRGEYIAVLNFTDTVPKGATGFAGLEARELTRKVFESEGLW